MRMRDRRQENGIKRTRRRNFIIAAVEVLGIASVFAVGFSAWLVTGGSDEVSVIAGLRTADIVNATPAQNLDVITISSLSSFQYAAGYGFVVDGVYGNSITLTGSCSFNAAYGKRCFDSFASDSNKSFLLDFKLSTALTNGFSGNSFASSEVSLTSTNFTVASQDPADGADITTTFTIACADNTSNFTFDFSVNLTYGGTLTSFPNLASANIGVTFTPRENG